MAKRSLLGSDPSQASRGAILAGGGGPAANNAMQISIQLFNPKIIKCFHVYARKLSYNSSEVEEIKLSRGFFCAVDHGISEVNLREGLHHESWEP